MATGGRTLSSREARFMLSGWGVALVMPAPALGLAFEDERGHLRYACPRLAVRAAADYLLHVRAVGLSDDTEISKRLRQRRARVPRKLAPAALGEKRKFAPAVCSRRRKEAAGGSFPNGGRGFKQFVDGPSDKSAIAEGIDRNVGRRLPPGGPS